MKKKETKKNSQVNSSDAKNNGLNFLKNDRKISKRLASRFPWVSILLNNQKGFKNTLINIKGYYAIKKNHLLDVSYYLKNNIDVKSSGKDPILHYIYHGFNEGRSPNMEFDANYYLNRYSDVKKSNLNPLVHYSLYGIKEGRITTKSTKNIPQTLNDTDFPRYSHNQINYILNALNNEKISIILVINNSIENTKNCINSILENTKIPYEIILIHDCNSDKRFLTFLDEIENIPQIKVIRNHENIELAKNINTTIQNIEGDVVLLNSNTIVTSKWLQKLVVAAYSNEKIGTVIPLSNASGIFSVPESGITNKLPEFLSLEDMGLLVEKVSDNVYMEVPNCNGYCIFIKQDAIKDDGLFDSENFGNWFDEENGFYIRTIEKTRTNILDDSTYIYHKKSPSFGEGKGELSIQKTIRDKKPLSYTEKVQESISNEFDDIQNKIKTRLKKLNISESNNKRILYVLHSTQGGTPATNEDLMRNIQNELDCYVLTSSALEVILWRYINNNFEEIYSWEIKSNWSAKDFHNPEFRDIYFNVLNGVKIDIIHVRHLIKHTFDLPDVAKSLGLPLIISFHDFYFICPSHNLIDDNLVYCAGKCTDSEGQCLVGNELSDLPPLKGFVKEWRNAVADVLSKSSALITTSELVKQLYISKYPELVQKEFKIIEHGRDFKKVENTSNIYEIPSKDKPIKILFPGNINYVKGSELIKKIKNEDKTNRLEFHFIGSLYSHSRDLEKLGIYHGGYERNDFCKIVSSIKPSFIGILSIWPETYCHTLSEAWSCGVPVLASKIGVLEERVNKNGGGWLLDHTDPLKAYNEIIRIADSPEEYLKIVEQVKNITFNSTNEMAEEYMEIYTQKLSNEHRISNHEDLKKTLKGKDGYLFLVNDSNYEIRQHFDQSYKNKFNPQTFIENLKYKQEYFKKKNIKYFFFITPDKSLICKEFLPFDRIFTKRNYDAINRLVPDFAENLDPTCYFKIDTHINYLGGKELSFCYLNNIDNNFKRSDYNKLIDEQIIKEQSIINRHFGDLLGQNNWSYSSEERENFTTEKAVLLRNQFIINLDKDLPEKFKASGRRPTEYYLNPHGFTNLKVLVLRDSTLNYLKDTLSVYFKEILLYWDHWVFNKELIEWYKPDIVLEIRTERFLEMKENMY